MKNSFVLIILTLVLSCTNQENDTRNLISSNKYLMGKWKGIGSFLNIDFNKDFGTVNFDIEINSDYSITGKLGDAVLTKTRIEKTNYGFNIKGKLDSKLKENKDFNKKHVIILLVIPKEHNMDVQRIDANFHIKSNYFFDISMRVGGVLLIKEP